ncbi:MAG: hypothetical protein AMS21_09960 [Gemmatimonas sp. SG8_38_2]|nr:MAG: hypothetical protein AMS21_09960 [Gemmatimonas sp. SG8_38_2]
MTQHGDAGRALFFLAIEAAADDRPGSVHIEEVGAHIEHADATRRPESGQREPVIPVVLDRPRALEGSHVLAEVEVGSSADPDALGRVLTKPLIQAHQAIGLIVVERPEDYALQYTEHRSIRTIRNAKVSMATAANPGFVTSLRTA